MGLQTQIINATTVGEINEIFATFERERPDALFVAPDPFLSSRRVQLATLTARDRIPATYSIRDYVEVGGLMSYGPDFTDTFRQVGAYTGSILKGAKPAHLHCQVVSLFILTLAPGRPKASSSTPRPCSSSIQAVYPLLRWS
jgi:putative ABC transport system substrate-binding protein